MKNSNLSDDQHLVDALTAEGTLLPVIYIRVDGAGVAYGRMTTAQKDGVFFMLEANAAELRLSWSRRESKTENATAGAAASSDGATDSHARSLVTRSPPKSTKATTSESHGI